MQGTPRRLQALSVMIFYLWVFFHYAVQKGNDSTRRDFILHHTQPKACMETRMEQAAMKQHDAIFNGRHRTEVLPGLED